MAKNALLRAILILFAMTIALAGPAQAEDRFPKPEFETGYQFPSPQTPLPRAAWFQILDTAVLVGAFALAATLIFRRRSRMGLYLLTLFSVLYFGFFRHGCVCPVGSIQNTFLSLTNGYTLPLVVLIFFTLPLLAALFFGRIFCSSICPLGALQELVIYKPIKLPPVVRHVLGLFPFLYLGLAILFAFTGSGFIICRFDPFIGFYRLSGPAGMIALGLGLLGLGLFVARPYCRFICPYGVLLGIFSFFSKKHLTITPQTCIQCRLCEQACPIDAIQSPSPKQYQTSRSQQIKRLGILLAIAPLFMAGLGFGFSRLTDVLARQNRTVALAERLHQEETSGTAANLDSSAFRQQQTRMETVYAQATAVRRQFRIGLWFLGLGMGAVIVFKLGVALQRPGREDFVPDRFHCVSCGRCMEYCPVDPAPEETV